MAGVKIADARRQIGEHVSAVIVDAFTRQVEAASKDGHVYRPWPHSTNPGHDPLHVPPVPLTIVDSRPSYTGEASSIFTWKAEHGEAPYLIYHVTPRWLTKVVRPGYALLGGYPVLDIVAETDDGLPAGIKAMELYGYFDSGIHGWRAWGSDILCAVEWSDGTPTVRPLNTDGEPRQVPVYGTL